MKCIMFLLMGVFLVSCKETEKERITRLVHEWEGKEIVYPSNIHFSILEKDTNYFPRSEYTVVAYIDSVGCTSCKLQLSQWKRLISQLDSLGNASVLLFVHPKNKKEMIYTLKRDNFIHPVCLDNEDAFNKLNRFPPEDIFQTFLLDKDNKVVAIGNPIHNPKVKELYLKIIAGNDVSKKEVKTLATVVCNKTMVNLGEFDWRQEQETDFTLTNMGNFPLVVTDVITSCGCTTVDYEKEPVQPGSSVKLKVQYKADHPEHFDKTITVYCNAETSPIKLRIKGNAE